MPEINANIQQGKYEEVLAAVKSPVIALIELIKNASDSSKHADDPIIIEIAKDQRTIRITDSGIGLSKKELDHLGVAGYSSKMINGNIKTPIDNSFAGSKGLGMLTAFFLANKLVIDTFSEEDKKAFHLEWKKGCQKYSYEECNFHKRGTIISLIDIAPDKLQMILLQEEKVKLFMASIRFFTNNSKLPLIRLIVDGKEESYYPNETLESFYCRNKGSASGFISKASFQYNDNKLTLSYEDNILNYYSFSNEMIDLLDLDSLDLFFKKTKLSENGVFSLKAICESRVFHPEFNSIKLPSFSGVLYTWRNRKSNDIEQWPSGVRIYTNNYSLYRYLDKENDWLNLSEISQNIRATNYKLKNTYGYIDLNGYNENNEDLKISKERDDFVDSMAQRKLIHVMRDVVIGVFSRIDMAVKNTLIPSFSLNSFNASVRLGTTFDLSSVVACNGIGLNDIVLDYDNNVLNINSDWIVSSNQQGSYEIKLKYGDFSQSFLIHFNRIRPEFSLTKNFVKIQEGNTINLRRYISRDSCIDVSPDDIEIVADNTSTILYDDLFDKNNKDGRYVISYTYGDYQCKLVIDVLSIDLQPGFGLKSHSISSLFNKLDELRQCSIKIPELIDAISSYYHESPTLCIAAVRILIDCSTRSFLTSVLDEDAGDNLKGAINCVMNICECNSNDKKYNKICSGKEKVFINEFNSISAKHKRILSRAVRRCINNTIDEIDLNMFVHNPNAIATDTTVKTTMQIIAPLLNYIFEVLILDYSINNNQS